MPNNSDSQHWRDLAEKAREQAKRVAESRSKQRLLRHADAYESLAEQIEQRIWKPIPRGRIPKVTKPRVRSLA
jgi:hypothetical protein